MSVLLCGALVACEKQPPTPSLPFSIAHTLQCHQTALPEVSVLAWAPSDSTLFVAGYRNLCELWNTSSFRRTADWCTSGKATVRAGGFAADGRCCYAAFDDCLFYWDVSAKPTTSLFKSDDLLMDVALRDDVAIAGGHSSTVTLVNVATGKSAALRNHTRAIQSLAVLDADRAVFGYSDGGVSLWDLRRESEVWKVDAGNGSVRHIAVSRDLTAIVAGSTGHAVVLDSSTGQSLREFDVRDVHQGTVTAAIRDDGAYVALGGENSSTVSVHDMKTLKRVAEFKSGLPGVTSLAFAHSHQWLAVGGFSSRVNIIDVSALDGKP